LPVAADLRYDSADPYAVCLALHVDATRTVELDLRPKLLADGIHRRVGLGDVVVEPVHVRRQDDVRITLRSPGGLCHAQLPTRTVARSSGAPRRSFGSGPRSAISIWTHWPGASSLLSADLR